MFHCLLSVSCAPEISVSSIKKGQNYPYLRVGANRPLSRLFVGQPQKKKTAFIVPVLQIQSSLGQTTKK